MGAVHEHVADDKVMAVSLNRSAPAGHCGSEALGMAEELQRILGYDPDNSRPWWDE